MHSLTAILGYLDPGSGAIILQVVLAALASLAFYFRTILLRPWAWFSRRQETPEPAETPTGRPEDDNDQQP